MAIGLLRDEECGSLEVVDRWFRQLDQRRIYHGAREWMVQVTGILCEEDMLWIQIADDSRWAGSVLLRVSSTTPVDQAVHALTNRAPGVVSYPKVVTALARNFPISVS